MKVTEMLKKAKQVDKLDDVPGDVEKILEDACPVCGRAMRKYRPCCGAKHGYVGCNCGYKVIL